jgi:UDP-N-acetylglucosamine/UDP-N-acetylgalactosamine diphosphorylase
MTTLMDKALSERVEQAGQEHILAFVDELSDEERQQLAEQIQRIDFAGLDQLVEKYVRSKPEIELPDDLEPAPYYPADPRSSVRPYDAARYRKAGEAIVAAGRVAAFTVAGGQGTRLGFDGPKGAYPGGPVTGKPLFQIFAEGVLATGKKYGKAIPWYIMTSPLNDRPTRDFFEEHDFFGLDRADVMFFQQGVMPSLDMQTGKLLLAEKGKIATNPDGHGGSLRALFNSGALDDMEARGVQYISYTQVDNPLVKMVDPLFVGLHAEAEDSSAEMSSKMVEKAGPKEKVGVFCRSGGRTMVIEYSDLPDELAEARDEDGSLRFNAGSVAIHIMSVDFVRRLNLSEAGVGGFSLPFHRAEKKVPYVDPQTGEKVEPQEPNAVKLEAFVFDALPLCRDSIILETMREDEFAPIKNASGVDSVETSAQIQSKRNARWLEAHNVRVPRRDDGEVDALIEISPLTALESRDLAGRELPSDIERGSRISL